jgi:hypothetical protein
MDGPNQWIVWTFGRMLRKFRDTWLIDKTGDDPDDSKPVFCGRGSFAETG